MNGLEDDYEDSGIPYQPVPVPDTNDLKKKPKTLDIALEIPSSELDLDLSAIIGPSESHTTAETEKVQKRASNVLKLSQEHEQLKAELRAMTERLEAAERRQKEYMARTKGRTSSKAENN